MTIGVNVSLILSPYTTHLKYLEVLQTRDYVKISVEMYLERVCKRHLDMWMNVRQDTTSTPLQCKMEFIRDFLAAEGIDDPDAQEALAKEMGFGYRSGMGEAIFAMVTAQPDVAHAVTRLSQHNVCPHKLHYASLHHLLKYLFNIRDDGIYLLASEAQGGSASGCASLDKQQYARFDDGWAPRTPTVGHVQLHGRGVNDVPVDFSIDGRRYDYDRGWRSRLES